MTCSDRGGKSERKGYLRGGAREGCSDWGSERRGVLIACVDCIARK